MSISQSKEFFINLKEKDIPKWNPKLSYYDQDPYVLEFFQNEWDKINNGVTINGTFIHPWLYFHVNFFKARIMQPGGREVVMSPPLDDHAWYFKENYQDAEEQGKGVCLFGTRGFTKTVIEASVASWTSLIKPNSIMSVNGGSKKDLDDVCDAIKLSNNLIHPAFKLPILTEDWKDKVVFGFREANDSTVHSTLQITNLEGAKQGASEKAAGGTIGGLIADEIGKFDPRDFLNAVLPKVRSQYGSNLVHILSGCVCAGTKVWNNNGDLINIEDLTVDQGILGFNLEEGKASKEEITYWQPPHEKPCYRVTTNKGRILECSNDHPILIRERYEKNNAIKLGKHIFQPAEKLVINDSVAIINGLPDDFFNGTEEMFDPYFVGMAIGDGHVQKNSSAYIFNADEDVKNYIKNKYRTTTYFSAPTKDGRTLEKFKVWDTAQEFKKLGLSGKARENKRLPIDLYKYRKEDIIKMIEGFYDADGCYYVSSKVGKRGRTKECVIKLTSCGRVILEEIQMLLTKFGIHSNIVFERLTENSSPKSTRGHYNLLVKDAESMCKFADTFTPLIKYKRENLKTIKEIWSGVKKTSNQPLKYERVKSIEYIGLKPVYNLTAGTTNTYIANGIVTHNTGGNSELSEGAKIILENPDDYFLIRMNWDRLDNSIPEEAITWKKTRGTTFCTFVPGHMSYRLEVLKQETTLADYVNKPEDKDLKKIKLFQTDWLTATKFLNDRLDSLQTDDAKNKQRMYHPMETTDCFLTDSPNPFNVARAQKKLLEVRQDPKYRLVDLQQNFDGTIKVSLSSKKLAEREYKNKDTDAPIMMFEDAGDDIKLHENTAGGDDYKLTSAKESTSLATMYIVGRRNVEINTPLERILACVATRPHESHNIVYDQFKMMLKHYKALCNLEAIDTGFASYLETIGLNMMDYLCPNINPAQDLTSANKKKANSRFGTYPTPANIKIMYQTVLDYTEDLVTIGFDDENEPIQMYGMDFIEDPFLLEEIIAYHPGGNFDRIVGFGWALVYSRYLDKKNIQPRKNKTYSDEFYNKNSKNIRAKKPNTNFDNFSRVGFQNF